MPAGALAMYTFTTYRKRKSERPVPQQDKNDLLPIRTTVSMHASVQNASNQKRSSKQTNRVIKVGGVPADGEPDGGTRRDRRRRGRPGLRRIIASDVGACHVSELWVGEE